jgi:hypothetical protein
MAVVVICAFCIRYYDIKHGSELTPNYLGCMDAIEYFLEAPRS